MRRLLAILIPWCLAGCVSAPLVAQPDREMKLWFYDKDAMTAEVLRFVPVGTPLEDARRIMTDQGFRCEPVTCDLGPPYLRCSILHKPATLFDPVAEEIWCHLCYDKAGITKVEVRCVNSTP